MYAQKGNKVIQVDEYSKAQYLKQGFNIVDEKGKIVEYGRGKTISPAEYLKVVEENERLKEELEALKTKKTEKKKEK